MIKMNKLKAIWAILFKQCGVVIFNREPEEGQTITVGRMIATFIKKPQE